MKRLLLSAAISASIIAGVLFIWKAGEWLLFQVLHLYAWILSTENVSYQWAFWIAAIFIVLTIIVWAMGSELE